MYELYYLSVNRNHSLLFPLDDAVVPSMVTCAFESLKTLVSNVILMTTSNKNFEQCKH